MFTAERFLTAVQASMFSQVMFMLECFVTDCTDERPLTYHHHKHIHILYIYIILCVL